MLSPRRARILAIGIAVTALNLRGAVVGVGPLLETIQDDTGMSATMAGVLTTLPIACFGLLGGVAPRLARAIGLDAALWLTMLGLTLGILIRMGEPLPLLFGGTLVIGVAIAIANVLAPAVIKRDFPGRTGAMTGIHTMGIAGGGALAAAIMVPIETRTGLDWRQTLGTLAIGSAVAMVVLLPRLRQNRTNLRHMRSQTTRPPRLWRNRLAWQVSLFMGLQSAVFFGLGSWTAPLLHANGISETRAGALWAISNIASLPFALLMPVLAQRLRDQRPLVVAIVALWVVTLAGLLIDPAGLALPMVLLFGIANGSALSLALMFMVLRSPDTAHAAALSGMAQAVGYTIAAFAPFLFGLLHDLTGGWTASLVLIGLILVPTLAAGWQAAKPRLVAPLPPSA
jgi:MFS transporter, CP family, cyanate transporter